MEKLCFLWVQFVFLVFSEELDGIHDRTLTKTICTAQIVTSFKSIPRSRKLQCSAQLAAIFGQERNDHAVLDDFKRPSEV